MVSRRRFLSAIGATALVGPRPGFALERKRRIGYLANDPNEKSPTFVAFVGAMRELGWVRGENLEVLYETSEGRDERFPEIAGKIAKADVDVIVTTGSPSTRAAKAVAGNIPIVFGSAANPVEQKFVASLARPGGNVTGLALLVQELGPKRLQLMKELMPHAKRFARMYQSNSLAPIQPAIIKEDEAAAQTLGVTVQQIPITHLDDIEPAFAAARRDRLDAIQVTAASVFVVNREHVSKLALRRQYQLPLMGPDGRFAEAGALMSYGEDFAARYRRAAFLVDKVLRGTKPADIPVEQPAIFELVVNPFTAKTLGISIPQSFLLQADRVIR